MKTLGYVFALSGFALIIVGVFMWSVPAALVAAGFGLLAAGLTVDWDGLG